MNFILQVLLAFSPSAWAGVGGSSIGGPVEPQTSCKFSLSRHPRRDDIASILMSSATKAPFVARMDAPSTPLLATILGVPALEARTGAVIVPLSLVTPSQVFELRVSFPRRELRLVFTIPPLAGEHGFFLPRADLANGDRVREHLDAIVEGEELLADAFWIPLDSRSPIPLNMRLAWWDGVSHLELTAAVPCDKPIPGYRMHPLLVERATECYVTLAEFERADLESRR